MSFIEESNRRLRAQYTEQNGVPTTMIPRRLSTAKGEWWTTDKGTTVHVCDDLSEMDPVPYHKSRAYRNGLYCPGCNARLMRKEYQ